MFDVASDWKSCLQPGTDVATLACIPVVLQNVINFLIIFAGIICVFFIVWAGYKFVMSEGDPEKVASARKTLTYAIAGFIFVLGSFLILNLIANFTGVTRLSPK